VIAYKFRNPLEDGIKVEKIVGWAPVTETKMSFLVKFEGIDEPEYIKCSELRNAFPLVRFKRRIDAMYISKNC